MDTIHVLREVHADLHNVHVSMIDYISVSACIAGEVVTVEMYMHYWYALSMDFVSVVDACCVHCLTVNQHDL